MEISQEYFANLIGMAASECYGVAGMINSTYQGLRYAITKSDVPDKGVRVKTTDGKLIVDIHIAVTYGINISAIVQSIIHNVRYTVEECTGFKVARVNVYVDEMHELWGEKYSLQALEKMWREVRTGIRVS